jgi:selenocysteine-specific elongation factor
MRKHFIVGTAGHVDHGKSTLIRALTGIDTDRLPEEKERGLSIDLGFANLSLPGDVVAGIVDVPGHERFLKNMLAGVGGYDVGMLVVDCQEGVMPQTREHLEILELLRTPRGLVVLTKTDLVDAEFLELVREDLTDTLKGTFLEGAPFVGVSAKTGKGLDELRQVLGKLLGASSVRPRTGQFRLPVDRAFLKAGFGTVVTGSLWSGTMRKGDRVVILPAGEETKIRGLQVHREDCSEAVAGQRVAVNLSGVEPGSIKRGMQLASPDWLNPSDRFDVRLVLSRRLPRALKHRARVRVYAGTAECFGYLVLLEGDAVEAGQSVLAQIVLEGSSLPLLRGDRLILRDFTASYTLGGGEVLEPLAQPHRRKDEAVLASIQSKEQGDFFQSVLTHFGPHQIIAASQLAGLLQVPAQDLDAHLQPLLEAGSLVRLNKGFAAGPQVQACSDEILGHLAGLQQKTPWRVGWRKEELLKSLAHPQPRFADEVFTRLVEAGEFSEQGRLFCLPGHQAQLNGPQQQALSRVLSRLRAEAFSPSNWSELSGLEKIDPASWKILESYLQESGQVVRLAPEVLFLKEVLEEGKRRLSGLEQPFTAAQARDALGTTRKFVIPLLEYYDQSGFTLRQGETRRIRGQGT